ncbi:MAG: hypothetical protein JXA99_14710 [Candidatus Lokiarchaeota archaeon]|nr:hypothetical protein [Candidatus Lokiarchaeota archaeon]
MDKNPFIRYENLYIIPSFHCRIEFAKLVIKTFYKIYPDVIAVELPPTIKDYIIEATDRLPYLSLIGYADELSPKNMYFIPIDPGDSIIEAILLGKKHNIPIEFIDFSVKNYHPEDIKLPDDYIISKIGLQNFYENISNFIKKKRSEKDLDFRNNFDFNNRLEKHYDPEKNTNNLEKDIMREMYMASRLIELKQVYKKVLVVLGMGHWDHVKYYLSHSDKLKSINTNIVPNEFIKIYNVRAKDARFLIRELPFSTFKWVNFKKIISKEMLDTIESPAQLENLIDKFDKKYHINEIFFNSKEKYQKEFKEIINLHRMKLLFRYLRNLSIIESKFLPNLIDLIIASKNIIDDDFAWKVMKKASFYPFNDLTEKYETLKLSYKGAYDSNGRFIKLRRHHSYYYKENKINPLKTRPEEKYPGEWRKKWNQGGITCSYPPEDLIQENYFTYLRKRAIKNLKNKRIKIEEFHSSIKDGIAIKETIRDWGIKKNIYIKNEQMIQGRIDTIVIIFNKDTLEKEQYPYKLTWWAEHDMECDMAFYATNPGDYLIGPGISHVEVGGVLSIFPPLYLAPIFESYMDEKFKDTKNKAERLLKAAIIYSKEKYILYIAKNLPRKYFFSLAGVKHKDIIFIPLEHFSKESYKTLKHMHILNDKKTRKIAHKYILI